MVEMLSTKNDNLNLLTRAYSYQQNSLKNSSEFWPNSQISEKNSSDFLKCVLIKTSWKILRFFCQKIGPINKFSEKVHRIRILQFSLKNMTNCLTNVGAASWTKFRGFFVRYFDMSTSQKSDNLVQMLRNVFENFIDRTKPRFLLTSIN